MEADCLIVAGTSLSDAHSMNIVEQMLNKKHAAVIELNLESSILGGCESENRDNHVQVCG